MLHVTQADIHTVPQNTDNYPNSPGSHPVPLLPVSGIIIYSNPTCWPKMPSPGSDNKPGQQQQFN
jgi:hypothetical protein